MRTLAEDTLRAGRRVVHMEWRILGGSEYAPFICYYVRVSYVSQVLRRSVRASRSVV
jgi:hypothetical protein